MKCPSCNHGTSRVVDSRPSPEQGEIRRRRECEKCTARFTTYERIDGQGAMVLKRDGRREPFDADKIRRALRIACRKRPVSADAIERAVGRVALSVDESPEQELPSEEIGKRLLAELAAVDEVSFARFASVYLRFERLQDFVLLAEQLSETLDTTVTEPAATQENFPEN